MAVHRRNRKCRPWAAVQGLATVTLSRLATTAGVSRATLYNYFPDVEAAITYYLVAQAKGNSTSEQLSEHLAGPTSLLAECGLRSYGSTG